MTTLLFTHKAFLDHDTGPGHPERPDRLRAIEKALSHEMFAGLKREEAPLSDTEPLRLVHDERYMAALEERRQTDRMIHLDPDTVMSPGTWEAALRAVGAALAATDAVMEGRAANAFCAIRPPGHHAEAARALGFCLFNNVAIAAFHARVKYGAERVAVVDFDVHHGNGTQAMFWRDKNALYISTHQMPLFPGTGSLSETGLHDNIVNAPLRSGDNGEVFQDAFRSRVLPALDRFAPDIIFISAGFDAHQDDPLASLELTEADFGWATQVLLDKAYRYANGRVVSLLEGGYGLTGLARSVAVHVRELMRAGT
jgi:acetoin utilization deacetylase AcuC-like enzyme